jgi:hypothetical protein
MIARTLVFGVLTSGLLAGCSPAPSENDYIEACLAKPDANEERCRCRAREGKAKLSPDAWEAFVLDEQGKDEESSTQLARLPIEEQSAFIGVAIEINRICGSED